MLTRRTFVTSVAVMAVAAAPLVSHARLAGVPRLRRKDCFFGLHFDLHPNKTDTVLGRDVSDEMVGAILRAVQPDFVQYDCKGHAGYMGYASKTGTSAPGIVRDSLEVWRRVTARHGVALFIHFSGVWDSLAVERHPEWAVLRPDGKFDDRVTSTFGPYVDLLMIPQLKEAAEKYDLDGAWVDGECWALRPDYSAAVQQAFEKATGVGQLPRNAKDPGWNAFLELNREQFRRYVKHYVDELHAFRPQFQIASNWLYSTFVPERPDLPVDFLSGDYLGNSAVSTARLEARYLAATGKPWDLMAWGFQRASDQQGPAHKPAVQLQQEATVVLAQGGGFQVYYHPVRSGHFDNRHIEVMSRLAKFCRARQAVSHKTNTLPQVGVLFSRHSLYATSNKLFGGWGSAANPARGLIDALVESHYSVDVIPDWKLEEAAPAYPLIAVPDWPDIGAEAYQALARYAKQGGRLLVIGAENARLFAAELGIRLDGEPAEAQAYITGEETFAPAAGVWQRVSMNGAKQLERRFPGYDTKEGGECAASIVAFGAGQVAGIFGPLGNVYATTHASAMRQFLARIAAVLFTPLIRLHAPPTVEMALRTKDGKLLVHLSNCTNMQVAGDYATTDFVPPVGPLRLAVRLPKAPRRVTLEPGARPLEGEWAGNQWSATIPSLDIHAVCVIES